METGDNEKDGANTDDFLMALYSSLLSSSSNNRRK